MKKISLILMAFALVCHGMMGQVFQNSLHDIYNIPTPNQSNLGTFGIIPVSPYTGKADVSIPIYSTTQRDVPLNINLTYDTSGLLINQLPGWTGHNWTLNAGGAITRKINGRPDEIKYEKGTGKDLFVANGGDYGDCYMVNVMQKLEWDSYSEIVNLKEQERMYFTASSYFGFDDCGSCVFYGNQYGPFIIDLPPDNNIWEYYINYSDYTSFKDSYGDMWYLTERECIDTQCSFEGQSYLYYYESTRDNFLEMLYNEACNSIDAKYSPYTYEGRNYYYELWNNLKLVSSCNELNYSNYKNYFTYAKDNNKTDSIYPMTRDASADIFYFNFLGITGQFFYGNDGNWKVQCDQNIYVKFDVDDSNNYMEPLQSTFSKTDIKQPKTIKGFTLIDEMGNNYIFGGDKTSIEYSTPLMALANYNTSEPWCAVSWMLKEVKDRFGNSLYKFNYSRGEGIVQFHNSYYDSSKAAYYEYTGSVKGHGSSYKRSTRYHSATVSSPVYLDDIDVINGVKIKFSHSKMSETAGYNKWYPNITNEHISRMEKNTYTFWDDYATDIVSDTYSPFVNEQRSYYYQLGTTWASYLNNMNLEKLDKISIFNSNNKENNHVDFTYDNTGRIHLTSISNADVNSNRLYTYQLEYNSFNDLPSDYLTEKIDYWGYYNGIDYVAEDNPKSYFETALKYNANVKTPLMPYLNESKKGMLSKIYYPTSGYSAFEYELNSCSKYMSMDRQTANTTSSDVVLGGLRIKSIANYNNGSIMTKKTYEYKNGTRSSGVVYSEPIKSYSWEVTGNISSGGTSKKTYSVTNVCSSVPFATSLAPIVGYSFVKETEYDNSYKTYSFTNYDTQIDDKYDYSMFGTTTPFDEYSSRQYMCGKLLQENVYDKSKNNIASTEYTYTSDKNFNNTHYVVSSNIFLHDVVYQVGTMFKLYYFSPKVEKVVSKVKNGSSWVTTTTKNTWRHYDGSISNEKHSGFGLWAKLNETVMRGNESLTSKNESMSTKYYYLMKYYCYDKESTLHMGPDGINVGTTLWKGTDQYFNPLIRTEKFHGESFVQGTTTEYQKVNGYYVPKYEFEDKKSGEYDYGNYPGNYVYFPNTYEHSYKVNSDQLSDFICSDTVATYVSYSPTFRPTDIIDESNVHHYLYWNKKDQLEGVIDLTTRLGIHKSATENLIKNGKSIAEAIKTANPEYVYTSMPYGTTLYEYDAMGNVSKITKGNNMVTNYEYDLLGRLTKVSDGDKKTLKTYKYHYSTQK